MAPSSVPPTPGGASSTPDLGGTAVPTCVPALGVALAGVVQPPLAPGVGKVDEEDELDEDEEEGADHTKVKPNLRGGEKPVKSGESKTLGQGHTAKGTMPPPALGLTLC